MIAPYFPHGAIYLSSSLCTIARLPVAQFPCPCSSLWVWSDLGPSSSHSDLKPVRQPDIKKQIPGGYSFRVLMFTFNIATYGSSHRPSKYCQNHRSFFKKYFRILMLNSLGLWSIHSIGTKCLLRLKKAWKIMRWNGSTFRCEIFPSKSVTGSDYFYHFSKQQHLFPLLQWSVQMQGLEEIFSGRYGYH